MTTGIFANAARVRVILRALQIRRGVIPAFVGVYAAFTMVGALLDGVSSVLLVSVFTNAVGGTPEFVRSAMDSLGLDGGIGGILGGLLVIYLLSLLIRFGLLSADGYLVAFLRQRIQVALFTRLLMADWAHMRDFRVGDAVGTTTQESIIVAKYLSSIVSAIYFTLGVGVLAALSLATSVETSLALGMMGLPMGLLLNRVFALQSRLSKESSRLRNQFSADVTDRLNGLLQIHVDANYGFHLQEGLRTQVPLTRLDLLVGFCQAAIGSFAVLLPLLAIGGLYVWVRFGGARLEDLTVVASVGLLGVRAASQFTGAVSAVGNLSRLSGSLYPVADALSVPLQAERTLIAEPTVSVAVTDATYAFGDNVAVRGVSLTIDRAAPLVITGRSGTGKTTLANLIAGLYFPTSGQVEYIGASGRRYPSSTWRARIGFVTQDIYLFNGSLRWNLTAGRDRTDEEVWSALEAVDAAGFVRAMGGLDTESAEAGRSLSGGERRRLGIARVLLSGSDVLIFDEVTAGLDQTNKDAVTRVIDRLSRDYIVLLISHDPISLTGQVGYAV